MLSILIPYRNRNSSHLANCLKSLQRQTIQDFEVHFIDYGSDIEMASKARKICLEYSFVQYIKHPVQYQPWNKSRALNSVIKNLQSDYCFVADVDMIFHPGFVKIAHDLMDLKKCIYFQVGFLEPDDKVENKRFESFSDYRVSTNEATGLSMFPVNSLRELRGFDEFYHFWGAEDTDMHVRFKNAGYQVEFYNTKILMLHQWHPTYRLEETSKLSMNLQLTGIVQINHQYMQSAISQKRTKVNYAGWGGIPDEKAMTALMQAEYNRELTNEKPVIDSFLYAELSQSQSGILKIKINELDTRTDFKHQAKKLFRKKVPTYYSLKDINDKVLLHIISFYRHQPYYYKVYDKERFIELAIKF